MVENPKDTKDTMTDALAGHPNLVTPPAPPKNPAVEPAPIVPAPEPVVPSDPKKVVDAKHDAEAEAQRVRADAPFDDPVVRTAAVELGGNPDSRAVAIPPEAVTAQAAEQPRPDAGSGTAPVLQTQPVLAPHAVSDDLTVNDPPATVPSSIPSMIDANDPLGRQVGDPNDFVEVPAERGPALNYGTSDRPMTLEELERAHLASAPTIQRRADVTTDHVRQDPVISDRTREEMNLGAAMVAEAAEGKFTPVPEGRSVPVREGEGVVAAGFEPTVDPNGTTRTYSQPPSITAQTRMEQEAGRAAVARRTADYAHGRDVMRRNAAQRLRDGAPADPGDLHYQEPKG